MHMRIIILISLLFSILCSFSTVGAQDFPSIEIPVQLTIHSGETPFDFLTESGQSKFITLENRMATVTQTSSHSLRVELHEAERLHLADLNGERVLPRPLSTFSFRYSSAHDLKQLMELSKGSIIAVGDYSEARLKQIIQTTHDGNTNKLIDTLKNSPLQTPRLLRVNALQISIQLNDIGLPQEQTSERTTMTLRVRDYSNIQALRHDPNPKTQSIGSISALYAPRSPLMRQYAKVVHKVRSVWEAMAKSEAEQGSSPRAVKATIQEMPTNNLIPFNPAPRCRLLFDPS